MVSAESNTIMGLPVVPARTYHWSICTSTNPYLPRSALQTGATMRFGRRANVESKAKTAHRALRMNEDSAMTSETDTQPDITRPGVDIAAVSQWESTVAADQRVRFDDLMDTWALTPPHGLLSFSCFEGSSPIKDFGSPRGTTDNPQHGSAATPRFMTYEQWSTEEAYRAFLKTPQPRSLLADALVTPVSVQLRVSAVYRLYRSHRNAISGATKPTSHNIVINTVDFDGPDEQRLRQWIDNVVDALEAEPSAIPGMISAHLHVSTTGDRVLNFAEWTSEQAYDEALATGPRGVGQSDLPEWRKIKNFPGVIGDTVNQYALYRVLIIPVTTERGS